MSEYKRCVQCAAARKQEEYRAYVSRGTGKYKTKTGRQTVCKQCTSVNALAAAHESKGFVDPEVKDKLLRYYQAIEGKVPAVGQRLLGIETPKEYATVLDKVLDSMMATPVDVTAYHTKLRNRAFDSQEEAEIIYHRDIESKITDEEQREDIVDLLEDWYLE